jgi:hypothetical protein
METKELEKYINEKVEEFRKDLVLDIKNKVKEVERPKTIWDFNTNDSDSYCYIDGDGYLSLDWIDENYFEIRRDLGNAFLTEEEAEFERERRKILTIMKKYSRPFEYNGFNYFIAYDYYREELFIKSYDWMHGGSYYFASKEIAEKVISGIGKDRLKKYYFGIKE